MLMHRYAVMPGRLGFAGMAGRMGRVGLQRRMFRYDGIPRDSPLLPVEGKSLLTNDGMTSRTTGKGNSIDYRSYCGECSHVELVSITTRATTHPSTN